MVESAMSIFAGLFGGIGAVLVWELFVRPLVQSRAIAEVLSAEVSFNLEYLTAAGLVAKPNSIPTDFSLSTSVFDSVIDHVGDLPRLRAALLVDRPQIPCQVTSAAGDHARRTAIRSTVQNKPSVG